MIGKIINEADRKVCAIVVALTVVLMNLPVRIAGGRRLPTDIVDIVDFIPCLAIAAMIALFAFNGKIPRAKYIVCKLWFIPAAIMAISVIFDCIRDIRYIEYMEGGARILYILFFLVGIVQYAFVGLWLRYEVSREETSENRLDDIVVLKKMYDDGVISEEEFTAKKKQILGI